MGIQHTFQPIFFCDYPCLNKLSEFDDSHLRLSVIVQRLFFIRDEANIILFPNLGADSQKKDR